MGGAGRRPLRGLDPEAEPRGTVAALPPPGDILPPDDPLALSADEVATRGPPKTGLPGNRLRSPAKAGEGPPSSPPHRGAPQNCLSGNRLRFPAKAAQRPPSSSAHRGRRDERSHARRDPPRNRAAARR